MDLLKLPLIQHFARWRYSRAVLQSLMLVFAALVIIEGFIGEPIAAKNLATVSVWLHYRGFVVLLAFILGNMFCAMCPLMLTKSLSLKLKVFFPERRFPLGLRNKYTVLTITVLYLFCYEYFDLWASPLLTAWLCIGYFLSALIVDTLFPTGTFCKHLCPLGNFNFALSHVSPSQITAKNPEVCLSCTGKYCLNGRAETVSGRQTLKEPVAKGAVQFTGCETLLYVPQIKSNQDCTLCLNCYRACPHDNVALVVRAPITQHRPKTDVALFAVVLFFAGLLNAFAMTKPYFQFAQWLSGLLHTTNELVLLGLLMVLGLGIGTSGTLWLYRITGGIKMAGASMFPLVFAMWAGHYSFHFLTGWASIIPSVQQAFIDLGLPVPAPDWRFAALVPENFLFPVQVIIVYFGLALSSFMLFKYHPKPLPLLAWYFVWVLLALYILAQPMQMRGTLLL